MVHLMSHNSSTNYMASFIGSLVGGILILVTDFAGWYESNSYLGIYSEGWIGTDSGGAALAILGAIGGTMLYVAYQSYKGTKTPLDQARLEQIYKFSLYTFIAIMVSALIFVIAIMEEDVDWWFDAGFYGGAIGSSISTLSLRNLIN